MMIAQEPKEPGEFYIEFGQIPSLFEIKLIGGYMKIIGIRPSSFKGDNNEQVSGVNIYLTYPLEKGTGEGADRVFLTDEKIKNWEYKPKVGDEVALEYNRYGRCAGMRKA